MLPAIFKPVHKGYSMSSHVLFILLNRLDKNDKM